MDNEKIGREYQDQALSEYQDLPEEQETQEESGYLSLLLEDEQDEDTLDGDMSDESDGEEGLDYEQRALKRRLREIETLRRDRTQQRKDWFRYNRTLIMVIASVLAVVLIFFGIKAFNDRSNPMSRFFTSASKNLSSSFSFDITAEKDGAAMQHYTGTAQSKPDSRSLMIMYDADCVDYQYTNVLYTDDKTTYKGNYYNGLWTISDRTDRVQDYFEFFNNFRKGNFDGGSFLRFFDKSYDYSSNDLNKLVNLVKDRLSTDSNIAKITTTKDDTGTTYRYDVDVDAVFELIVSQGASVFVRSTDYDTFVKKVDANRAEIEATKCTFSFIVTPEGYLSRVELELSAPDASYAFRCEMNDYSAAVPEIPDEFYEAAGVEKPQQQ